MPETRIYKLLKQIPIAKKVKDEFYQNSINLSGWSTKRRLIVIESDDWGSIRMPSREVYNNLLKLNKKVDECPFCKYDSLASESDLTFLFEVLTKYKDQNGNHPAITANCVMANPDFDKIERSEFTEYHYELFPETLKRYPEHGNSLELWKDGIEGGIFFPQLHGREHINVPHWLKALKNGDEDVRISFRNRMFSTNSSYSPSNKYFYMDALNYDTAEEEVLMSNIIRESTLLFQKIFSFNSKSFIAPCYIWGDLIERILNECGVRYIQGVKKQLHPLFVEGTSSFGEVKHFIGQKNKYNQIYLHRNCEFEPSWNKNFDWITYCLWQIETAFRWDKPAAISCHRLNFIGFIDVSNRDTNLKLLDKLLFEIKKRWPNVEFVTSNVLGNIITDNM